MTPWRPPAHGPPADWDHEWDDEEAPARRIGDRARRLRGLDDDELRELVEDGDLDEDERDDLEAER